MLPLDEQTGLSIDPVTSSDVNTSRPDRLHTALNSYYDSLAPYILRPIDASPGLRRAIAASIATSNEQGNNSSRGITINVGQANQVYDPREISFMGFGAI